MKSGFIKTFLQMAPFLGSAHLLVAWISTASSLHGTALDILTQHPDYNKTVVSLLQAYFLATFFTSQDSENAEKLSFFLEF